MKRLPTPKGITSPQPAPAGPNAGNGPYPKMRTGVSPICAITQPTRTPAGRLILPVPRTALPSRLSTVIQTAPPKATLAYASASISILSRPPIQPKINGAASTITVEKIAASASANRKAWKASSSARSRLPAPSARATADDTPAPMPLLVVCRTSMIQGNASDAPASASVPILPRKKPSKVITPTKASRLRMFGAASRSSVARIGPSRSNLVRAATGRGGGIAGEGAANVVGGMVMLWSLMGAPPRVGLEQRLRRQRPQGSGGCVESPMALHEPRGTIDTSQLSATHLFSGMPEKISLTIAG